jgi:hypothetical protein
MLSPSAIRPRSTAAAPPRRSGALTLPEINSLNATGSFSLYDPALFKLHLFGGFSRFLETLKIPLTSFAFTNANTDFTIENGNIKLISGRPDKTEFDGVKVEYPKGTKEICLFVEKNRDSLLPMNEELFLKDYKLCQHRNNLMGELMGMDMTIEDFRERMDNPPSSQDKKTMNRLWNERQKIVKQICKVDNKEKILLSGKIKKKNERER